MNRLNLGIDLTDRGCTMAWYHSGKGTMEILVDQNGESVVPSYLALNPENGQWSSGYNAEQMKGNSGYYLCFSVRTVWRSIQVFLPQMK